MNKTSKSTPKQAGPKKLQIVVIALVIAIVTVVGVAVAMSRKSDSNNQTKPQNGSVSLHGELVCLPHKNTDGPQTLECAIGFKSEDGKYYSLKDDTNKASGLPFNTPVEVSGTFQSESSEIYQSEGSITVTTIKEHAH